jgi:hypothetical protein
MWEAPNAFHISYQPAVLEGVVSCMKGSIRSSQYKPSSEGVAMPKFVIERDIPNAGSLSPQQLQEISEKSRGVLREMGTQTQWVESYVTDDKIYCVYLAPDEDALREHARQAGFPANRISRISSVIDPTTAE